MTRSPIHSPVFLKRCGCTRTLVSACVLIAGLPACAKKDLTSELDRTRSWTATTRLAVDRRAAGAINDAVTSQLLKRASEALPEEEKSIATLATSDSERTAARGVLDSLRQGILRLRQVAP